MVALIVYELHVFNYYIPTSENDEASTINENTIEPIKTELAESKKNIHVSKSTVPNSSEKTVESSAKIGAKAKSVIEIEKSDTVKARPSRSQITHLDKQVGSVAKAVARNVLKSAGIGRTEIKQLIKEFIKKPVLETPGETKSKVKTKSKQLVHLAKTPYFSPSKSIDNAPAKEANAKTVNTNRQHGEHHTNIKSKQKEKVNDNSMFVPMFAIQSLMATMAKKKGAIGAAAGAKSSKSSSATSKASKKHEHEPPFYITKQGGKRYLVMNTDSPAITGFANVGSKFMQFNLPLGGANMSPPDYQDGLDPSVAVSTSAHVNPGGEMWNGAAVSEINGLPAMALPNDMPMDPWQRMRNGGGPNSYWKPGNEFRGMDGGEDLGFDNRFVEHYHLSMIILFVWAINLFML